MYLPWRETKKYIIYFLLLCSRGLRYMLATKLFIATTGSLPLVNIIEEKYKVVSVVCLVLNAASGVT